MSQAEKKTRFERKIYAGTSTSPFDTAATQMEGKFGIKITDNPFYEVRMGGVGAYDVTDDGSSFDGGPVSDFEVYEVYDIDPPVPIPVPPIQIEEDVKEKEKPKNLSRQKIQDMLDKYYGNRTKEKEYRQRMKRFKSHIVKQEYEKGIYRTVAKYPEYEEDAKFLQLEEFAFRLERLSKAELGDHSLYETAAKNMVNPTSVVSEEDLHYYSKLLRKQDADYIETNNFAYNQHKTTHNNLKTLGKHGEKVAYLKTTSLKDMKGGTKKEIALSVGKNISIVAFNTFLLARNWTLAPAHRFVGTFIVAPVHKLLFNADKKTAGIYKNLRTHRYTARKKVFEEEYKKEVSERNILRLGQGKKIKKPNIFVLAFKPRFQAITKVKEGNIKVLTPKAHEIVESVREHERAKAEKKRRLDFLNAKEAALLVQMSGIEEAMKRCTNPEEAQQLKIMLQQGALNLLDIKEQKELTEKRPVKGVVQTDAVSMEQHEMANRSNVTKVVTGVKTGVKIAAMYYVGKNLSKTVAEEITEERKLPDKVVPKKVEVPEQTITEEVQVEVTTQTLDTNKLSNIEWDELAQKTNNTATTYFGNGNGSGPAIDPDTARLAGAVASKGIGNQPSIISGADGIGYSTQGLTDATIAPIAPSDKVIDTMSEIVSKSGSPTTTTELLQDLSQMDINDAWDQISGIKPWLTPDGYSGKGWGWGDWSDAWESMKNDLVITTTKMQPQLVTKTIPAHTIIQNVTIPGGTETVVRTVVKDVIDGRALATEALLGAGVASDMYNLLRRTKGKEELKEEGIITNVRASEKNNLPYSTTRNYNNTFGFTGDRKGDYGSLYDESPQQVEEQSVGRKR